MNDAPELLEQGSEEWLIARHGSLGGSKIGVAIERLKTGKGKGDPTQKSLDFMYELAAERLTGLPAKRVNPLQWGADHEDEARSYYETFTNLEVVQVGLIPHPAIAHAHASPDGLVGDAGGLEIKCPTSATHLKTLIEDEIPEEHLPQIYWNMACAGPKRQWWDFVSYDPRFLDPKLRYFCKRVERVDKEIEKIEIAATEWLAGLDNALEILRARLEAA